MNFRHISITARLAPLEVVLTEEHQIAVRAEADLALAAPVLFDAAKSALTALEALKAGNPVDLELIKRDLRAALVAAGEEF
jgi:hypothetical protein